MVVSLNSSATGALLLLLLLTVCVETGTLYTSPVLDTKVVLNRRRCRILVLPNTLADDVASRGNAHNRTSQQSLSLRSCTFFCRSPAPVSVSLEPIDVVALPCLQRNRSFCVGAFLPPRCLLKRCHCRRSVLSNRSGL